MKHLRVGFIGAGNMAAAMIEGLLAEGLPAEQICACDPASERLDLLKQLGPLRTSSRNTDAVADADIVVLAVKPQAMASVLGDVREALVRERCVILSIAAGLTLGSLEAQLGDGLSIVRCMPNTPALVREGAAALYENPATSTAQREIAAAVLGAVGTVCWLDNEAELDTVTALSGSGPAYFFFMMESMIAAGAELGMDEATARELVVQTALGAARMAGGSELDLAELRRRVTSPGGTTEAAIKSMESTGFPTTIQSAVNAAASRSRELAAELG